MVPDRARRPDPITAGRPAELPCSHCGRSRAERLTLSEAFRLVGYSRASRADCPFCHLTDLWRPEHQPNG